MADTAAAESEEDKEEPAGDKEAGTGESAGADKAAGMAEVADTVVGEDMAAAGTARAGMAEDREDKADTEDRADKEGKARTVVDMAGTADKVVAGMAEDMAHMADLTRGRRGCRQGRRRVQWESLQFPLPIEASKLRRESEQTPLANREPRDDPFATLRH